MTFLFTASACVNGRGGCKLAADLPASEDISVAAGPDDEGFSVIDRPDGRDFSDTDSSGQSNDGDFAVAARPDVKALFWSDWGDFLLLEETILSSVGEQSVTTRGIEVRDNEGSKGLTTAALPKEEAAAVRGV
jgi:hypothetical protein